MKELLYSKEQIDLLYQDNSLENLDSTLEQNEYLLLKSPYNSALVKNIKNTLLLIKDPKTLQGITPKDSKQKCFINSLLDPQVLMSVALGKAGTGKTLLSIAYALNMYFKASKKIILIKPSTFVGGKSSVMGILPGDVNDKLSGLMASYMVHIKSILGRNADHYLYDMIESEDLIYLPVEMARGMSLENATVIFDECQNADVHTMKTIVSRVASTSKLICLGDLGQIDAPFPKKDSGLSIFINSQSFKTSYYTSKITLTSQYRSVLADLCESITDEYYNLKD